MKKVVIISLSLVTWTHLKGDESSKWIACLIPDSPQCRYEKARLDEDNKRAAEESARWEAWKQHLADLARAKSLAEAAEISKREQEAQNAQIERNRQHDAEISRINAEQARLERKRVDEDWENKTHRKKIGDKLMNGSKTLSDAPDLITKALPPLQNDLLNGLQATLRPQLTTSVANIHTTRENVRKQRSDTQKREQELINMGLADSYDHLITAFDKLETALTKLADTDASGKCPPGESNKGVLCSLILATDNNYAAVSNLLTNVTNTLIPELENKSYEGISCIHCPGGNFVRCSLIDRLYYVGKWIWGQFPVDPY